MITRQLLLCLGTTVALSPLGAQVYAGIGVCPVGPVAPRAAAPHVVRPRAPRADPVPGRPFVPPGPVTAPAPARPAAPSIRPAPAPPEPPPHKAAPHPARAHHAPPPYHPAAQQRLAPAGFSTVTLMLVVTTPAVLAAAVLRPRSRSGARSCRNG
ncbi:hypothetical protein ACGFRG_06975 [Streptomyces sp. NPDC048696]|uniref:hypothetical protein n=1 Tax=Streptomyces sp. NPDC048696 TaxID=3365585 RepID=UPI003724135B